MATQPIKCVGGDFMGNGGIRFGILWWGPSANKFQGMTFSTPKKKYKATEIVRLTEMGQEQAKSFLGAAAAAGAGALLFGGIGLIAGALAGGNKHKILVASEFSDGKKAAFFIDPQNKPYICLKLYALEKGLVQHSF